MFSRMEKKIGRLGNGTARRENCYHETSINDTCNKAEVPLYFIAAICLYIIYATYALFPEHPKDTTHKNAVLTRLTKREPWHRHALLPTGSVH